MFDVVVEAEEVPLGFYGFFLVYLQKFLYKEQAEPPDLQRLARAWTYLWPVNLQKLPHCSDCA